MKTTHMGYEFSWIDECIWFGKVNQYFRIESSYKKLGIFEKKIRKKEGLYEKEAFMT